MAFEQRPNSGALFKNDRKSGPKSPDYTGNCLIDGQVKRIAAWIKQGQQGAFMSLAFSEPQERQDQGDTSGQQPGEHPPTKEDGCPF
jgi:uncharacterized protein (DUF736 family)